MTTISISNFILVINYGYSDEYMTGTADVPDFNDSGRQLSLRVNNTIIPNF